MENRKKLILSLLCATISLLIIYIVLHELGHTLVAAACGAKVTNFNIITAHMSYTGGNFSQVTYSLLNAAGMLLPVIVCLIFILLYNRDKKNLLYHYVYMLYTLMTASSVLAWIIVPLLYMFAIPPAGDDVTNFLIVSRWDPLIVIACAVFIIASLILPALYKGIFKIKIK